MTAPATQNAALPRSRRERECWQCQRRFCAVSSAVVFCRTECGDAWRAEEQRKADRERRRAAKTDHARRAPEQGPSNRALRNIERAGRREMLERLRRKFEQQHTEDLKLMYVDAGDGGEEF